MIAKIKLVFGSILLLSVLITLSQCATANREAAPALPDLKTGKMSDQIERLEAIASSHADRAVRARAHLRLANLYSSHNNPKPNYQQALKELETYLSLDPVGETDEMRDRLALLREVVKENEENKKQKQTITQLTKENSELKGTLEELKNLDIRMEEKRKQVK